MEIRDALRRATELLDEFGLEGWSAVADSRPTRRFGQTRYNRREIGLSTKLVVLNTAERVEETIRHEIAHALVGPGHGHGEIWKRACYRVGAPPRRCYEDASTNTPPTAWQLICDRCGYSVPRSRRTNARYGHRVCGGTMSFQRAVS